MAKRKRKKRQRDVSNISKPKRLLKLPVYKRRLYEIEDNRKFRPMLAISSRRTNGYEAEIEASIRHSIKNKNLDLQFAGIRYRSPKDTIVCVRRRERRKALFASKKAGKGRSGRNFKSRIMTDRSKVRCK